MAVWEARTFNQSEDLYSANWQHAPHMARRRGGSSQQALDARGKEIVRSGTILYIGSARHKVSSQSVADAFYDVSFGPDGWRCTCPYHLHGNRRCKHIRAVYGTIMCERRLAGEGHEGMAVTEPPVACRFCHSTDCTERGMRNNKNGTVPRYRCGRCKRRFTHNPVLWEGTIPRR